MKRKYRIWDGIRTEYFAWLTDSEAAGLRRQGFYVIPV